MSRGLKDVNHRTERRLDGALDPTLQDSEMLASEEDARLLANPKWGAQGGLIAPLLPGSEEAERAASCKGLLVPRDVDYVLEKPIVVVVEFAYGPAYEVIPLGLAQRGEPLRV